ncbi:hypothetical protein M3Y99_00595500 [Aphelenchoides fujianensis]|nr:hypothetical protein M3Y99_00595500 [Aphelenchoides fujianensis]
MFTNKSSSLLAAVSLCFVVSWAAGSFSQTECPVVLKDRIETLCTYPGEDEPCYKPAVEFAGKVHEEFEPKELVAYCCDKDMERCQRSALYNDVCCTTLSCLRKCYKLDRRHHGRFFF